MCIRLVGTVVLCALLLAACASQGQTSKGGDSKEGRGGTGQGPPAAPVEVATAELQAVPLQVESIGAVEEFSRVEVQAQVGGQLQRVYFQEGQDVCQGDLLFQIDPRTYQAAVREAEAAVARDQAAVQEAQANAERAAAEARNARSQYDRFDDLGRKGIISRLQTEQYRTNAETAVRAAEASKASIESARAAVASSQAQLAETKLQLGYTAIRAPISGRTGSLAVKAGNLVQANGGPLVVINRITPIYATFSVPEQTLDAVRRYAGGRKRLPVQAKPNQGDDGSPPAQGTLDFLDNEVDESTGTIRMKALFPNTDRRLWPGRFVNVVLTLVTEQVVTIPTRSVQRGQQGDYVFLVTDDNTAQRRPVRVARNFGDRAVLEAGVRPGERVVTDGQLAVRPGGKVRVGRPQQGPANMTPAGNGPQTGGGR